MTERDRREENAVRIMRRIPEKSEPGMEKTAEDKKEQRMLQDAYADMIRRLVERKMICRLLDGIHILCNPEKRVTTVLWGDGSVTCVRAADGTEMDDYAAFTAAFAKRMIGSNTRIRKLAGRTQEMQKK